MERHIKLLRRTIGLFSSMISSGEAHSRTTEKQTNNALTALEQLTLKCITKKLATEYAEFCVGCDRKGLTIRSLDDYVEYFGSNTQETD